MAAGKAIVSTSIGCEGIEGVPNRDYLICDSAQDFTEKVLELLKNRDYREFLGRNARRVAEERYDWKIIGRKLRDMYGDYEQYLKNNLNKNQKKH